jgi:hypothetical protein
MEPLNDQSLIANVVTGMGVVDDYQDLTHRDTNKTIEMPSLKVNNMRVPKQMRKYSDTIKYKPEFAASKSSLKSNSSRFNLSDSSGNTSTPFGVKKAKLQ